MKRYTLGSSSISPLEKQYVDQVLNANFISPGPMVKDVERMCAEIHGLKHCVTLNSGQSAIQVGLQALIRKFLPDKSDVNGQRPLVAVPACTYISTLAAAIYANCDLVLVDVALDTGNMCPNSLYRVLEQQIRRNDPVDIVIPVHLYGKACHPNVRTICENYNLLVLEDACEATAVPTIGWGHILTTSFFSNHLISGGLGGAIMTNDKDLRFSCWQLVNHGRADDFSNDNIHQISDKFRFSEWGHSMKWSDVNAAIVKAQLERMDELYQARDRNALVLWKYLWGWDADYDKIILPEMKDHRFMMYPIVVRDPLNADNVIRYLNDHGIEVRRMMPITNQPVVKNYFGEENLEQHFPNADLINRQGFYVGCHPELSEDDMAAMGQIIHEALKAECLRHDPSFVAPHEVRDE